MEWQLKPLSKNCGLSGELFKPGEKIYCFIFKDSNNEIARMDVKESVYTNDKLPKSLLGKWVRVAQPHKSEQKKELESIHNENLSAAEALFISTYEHDIPSVESFEEKILIQQLLSLFLERKKILKREKYSSNNLEITYQHIPSKKTYSVPQKKFSIETIIKLQKELNIILT